MTKTRRYAVACFLLCSFAAAPSAQPSSAQGMSATATETTTAPAATGKVVGPDSKPQAGVPIQVTGPEGKTTAFTDVHGNWSLYNLAPGTYKIKPAASVTTTAQTPTTFTIQPSGFFKGLLGGSKNPTYYATEMKLDKNWTSMDANQE